MKHYWAYIKKWLTFAILPILIGAAYVMILEQQIDRKAQTIHVYEQEIAALHFPLEKIKDLRNTKKVILTHVGVYFDIQEAKGRDLPLLSMLAMLPEGITLSEFSSTSKQVMLKGKMDSPGKFATLVKQLEDLGFKLDDRPEQRSGILEAESFVLHMRQPDMTRDADNE